MRSARVFGWTQAIVVAALLLTASVSSAVSLEGAWVRVWPAPDVTDSPPVKILAGAHFAFGEQSADGSTALAGGGTYKVVGDVYLETIEYHYMPELIGQTIAFSCRIQDGQWHHAAQFTIDGRQFDIREIWQKIEDTASQ